jgi:hypothetical protein
MRDCTDTRRRSGGESAGLCGVGAVCKTGPSELTDMCVRGMAM